MGSSKWNVFFVSVLKLIHSKMRKCRQRYRCPNYQQTFTDTLDTLYYRRKLTPVEVENILQTHHTEDVSLRGSARLSNLLCNTGVDVVRASSQKAQLVHNEEVKDVETAKVIADEMWSFVKTKTKTLHPRRVNARRLLDWT